MKALALISGGIDSPVAAYLMKERGVEVIPLHFTNSPFSDKETREKAIEAAKKLGFKEMYLVPHGENLLAFAKACERKFSCVFCRRTMLRIAEKLAEKLGAEALITGESLGQVASQTPQNLFVEDKGVKIPILRPLIGFNKEETIEIARKIGTYSISTKPAQCCTMAPPKPSTAAKEERMLEEEAKLNLGELIENSLQKAEKISLGD